MTEIKVSIIVPIYNVEQYLRECLDSIKRQTLKEIEIICVNDGSTDGSLCIIQEYARNDKRFIVLDGSNAGYGAAMNKGIDLARGQYIGIVEPDDYIKRTMYEKLYNCAVSNDLDLIKADFYTFKGFGIKRKFEYRKIDFDDSHYNRLWDLNKEPECVKLVMNTWTGIYKRDFIKKNNIRHNETPGASFQDNGFFWQTFTKARRAMFVNQAFYMCRRDNPNSSVNSSDKVYCMNKEYQYIYELLIKDKETWEKFKDYFTFLQFNNYMWTYNRILDCFKKEYLVQFAKEMLLAKEENRLNPQIMGNRKMHYIELLLNDIEELRYELLLADHEEIEKELVRIRKSFSYQLGLAITLVPRLMRKGLKRICKGFH